MGYWGQFDRFDPLGGDLPYVAPNKLKDVVQRARRLLPGRTNSQLSIAAEVIDWFIDEYFEAEKSSLVDKILANGGWELGYLEEAARTEAGVRELLDNWPSSAGDNAPDYPNSQNTSDFRALVACIDNYIVTDDSEFPEAQPWEYFAVLALWKVADCIRSLNPTESTKVLNDIADGVSALADQLVGSSSSVPYIYKCVMDELCEALECVCWAEHLQESATLKLKLSRLQMELSESNRLTEARATQIAENRVSVSARKAAIKRHAENRAMKADVWEWCEKNFNDYSSMEKAAEAVIHTDKLVPVTVRTARQWISEWVKDQRSARTL